MVINLAPRRALAAGILISDFLVAMMLLTGALLPVSLSIAVEKRSAVSAFHRAAAMEIVDGEMEVLMAGEWRSFGPGTREYPLPGGAVTNLPPGQLLLTVQSNRVRLEWRPDEKDHGGPVVREAAIR
jgi:hypothetical protein